MGSGTQGHSFNGLTVIQSSPYAPIFVTLPSSEWVSCDDRLPGCHQGAADVASWTREARRLLPAECGG